MKLTSKLGLALAFVLLAQTSFSQVFWTETFGTGCNTGTLADGFVSANGTWTVTATGTNGVLANLWYVSAEENGEGVGNCGAGCNDNPTLHIGSGFLDFGAAYLADNALGDPTTNVRAETPIIDCSGRTDICLAFEYIENGDGALDNHTLWYFDGATWTQLDDTPKTPLVCAPQGQWSAYNISLPSSADNNPNVRIGFQWVNNDDGIGTDPSVAIDNIRLTGTDDEAPSLNCVSDINVFIDQDCEGTIPDLILPPNAFVWDNCTPIADLVVTQDIPAGTPIFGHLTVQVVEVTVVDLEGNSNTCNITVRTLDSIPPSLDCPSAPLSLPANSFCEATLPDYTALLNPSDNCTSFGDLTLSQNPPASTVISADQVVVYTAMDNAGNVRTCEFTVEFIDDTPPNITCPVPQSQFTTAASCDTLVADYLSMIVWTDNCTSSAANMTFTQIPASGTLLSAGNHTIEIIAEDEAGNENSCTFNLEIIDNVPPVFSVCPPDSALIANNDCQSLLPDFTSLVAVDDNCTASASILLGQTPSPGSLITGTSSTTIVVISATDASGVSATCNIEVTLVDTVAPTITCPPASSVSVNADCAYEIADFTGAAIVNDNCTNIAGLSIDQVPFIGTSLNVGTNVVELVVTDEAGNQAGCTFNLNVQDLIEPEITDCPPAQQFFVDGDCNAQIVDVTGAVAATDNCTVFGDLVITQLPIPGTTVNTDGNITITVQDLSGNSSTCLVAYELMDTISPALVCPASEIVTISADCDYLAPDFSSIVDVTDNCTSVGDLVVSQLPLAGAVMTGAGIIEVTVTDEEGNSNSCLIDIIPDDNIAPTIICPSDNVVNAGVDCSVEVADFTSLATVDDNCPGFLLSQSPAPLVELPIGIHEIELTVVDAGGNSASCTFELAVTESITPTIDCPDNVTSCDPVVAYDAPVADDNCSVFTVTQIDGTGLTSGSAFPVGITNQEYEVVDLAGNTSSCLFTVEVFEFPDDAQILTTTTSLCDTTSIVLMAEEPQSGSGEWMVITGSGTLNNQFASTTGANNLSIGLNQFVWEVSTTSCGSTTDTISVTVYQQPLPAITQDTLILCLDTAINVSGNTPNVGQGLWYSPNPAIQFLNSNQPNTLAFNLSSGWNDLVWSITNGSCPANEDTLRVFFYQRAQILTPDTTICAEENTILLQGTPLPPGVSGLWYFIQGGGDIASIFSSSTEASNLRGGLNQIVYANNHPFCGATSDTISINVELCEEYDPLIPTVFTPNNDGKNDLFVIENLNALYPQNIVKIVNRWGNLVFESEGYEDPWDGTNMNNGELLPPGTYFYRIYLNDDKGTEITGPISIIR